MKLEDITEQYIVFIESHLYMSTSEAIAWIKKHKQDEIDELFDEYMVGLE